VTLSVPIFASNDYLGFIKSVNFIL
jgi:hypothetical protein